MKVYIVTSGCYSDYHIEAVFTNEEQAELYCATHEDCDIEYWKADEIKISPVDVFTIYEIMFDDEFNKRTVDQRFSLKPERKIEEQPYRSFYTRTDKSYVVTVPVKRGMAEDKAVKIARDYLFQYLMEQIENEKSELALRMEALKNES